jgi:hypothetical protein
VHAGDRIRALGVGGVDGAERVVEDLVDQGGLAADVAVEGVRADSEALR